MSNAFGGATILIVVGVALDTMRQMESQLVMRNYEGFMKSSGPGWTRKEGQWGQQQQAKEKEKAT